MQALIDRSVSLLNDGQLGEATKLAKDAAERYPNSADAWIAYGNALVKGGRHAAACNIYADAIKQNNDLSPLLLGPLRAANDVCHHFDESLISFL